MIKSSTLGHLPTGASTSAGCQHPHHHNQNFTEHYLWGNHALVAIHRASSTTASYATGTEHTPNCCTTAVPSDATVLEVSTCPYPLSVHSSTLLLAPSLLPAPKPPGPHLHPSTRPPTSPLYLTFAHFSGPPPLLPSTSPSLLRPGEFAQANEHLVAAQHGWCGWVVISCQLVSGDRQIAVTEEQVAELSLVLNYLRSGGGGGGFGGQGGDGWGEVVTILIRVWGIRRRNCDIEPY